MVTIVLLLKGKVGKALIDNNHYDLDKSFK